MSPWQSGREELMGVVVAVAVQRAGAGLCWEAGSGDRPERERERWNYRRVRELGVWTGSQSILDGGPTCSDVERTTLA